MQVWVSWVPACAGTTVGGGGGSSDTMGRCSSERSVVKAGLVPGLGFLDCGLRRNDGWGAGRHGWPVGGVGFLDSGLRRNDGGGPV